MPLVLESEGPRLEGVEGEVSELRGEEKPSWGRSTLGQPASPRVCWPEREGALGSSLWVPPPGLWDTVGARRPAAGHCGGKTPHCGVLGGNTNTNARRAGGDTGRAQLQNVGRGWQLPAPSFVGQAQFG